MDRRDVTRMGTCCYCGSRTVLELTARGGHELACGACGAPIHEMKGIRAEKNPSKSKVKREPSGYAQTRPPKPGKKKSVKKKLKKKSKGLFGALDDVFDDAFDLFDLFD